MANTLLVIGIHREELGFSRAVAAAIDRSCIDVLEIPEGLPGRHPRADERFRHEMLHRALYLQLLPHMHKYRLLIDLHTGIDENGPGVDLYSHEPDRISPCVRGLPAPGPGQAGRQSPRLIQLGDATGRFPPGKTVIPREVWLAGDCLYVGMEVYLKKVGAGETAEHRYARELIEALAHAVQPAAWGT